MRIKDIPLKGKIWNKHKKTQKTLWVITWIIFLPIVLLQVINDGLDIFVSKCAEIRSDIVYTIFKIIYKKELLKESSNGK